MMPVSLSHGKGVLLGKMTCVGVGIGVLVGMGVLVARGVGESVGTGLTATATGVGMGAMGSHPTSKNANIVNKNTLFTIGLLNFFTGFIFQ
jgi:hypothetical protein